MRHGRGGVRGPLGALTVARMARIVQAPLVQGSRIDSPAHDQGLSVVDDRRASQWGVPRRPSAVSPQATPDLPGTVAAQVRGTVERVGAQNAALSTSTLVAAPPTAVSPAATETPVPAQATATPVPSVATRTLPGLVGRARCHCSKGSVR